MGTVISYAKNNGVLGNNIDLGESYQQKIDLHSTGSIGIGTQAAGPYIRTHNGMSVYTGGTHHETGPGANGSTLMTVSNDGDAVFYGDITGFGSPSDVNIKKNISAIDNALECISHLHGVKFDFKENYVKNYKMAKRQVGIIAQDLQKVMPELVHNKNNILHVDYDRIVALLIEAVKELKTKIDILENKHVDTAANKEQTS